MSRSSTRVATAHAIDEPATARMCRIVLLDLLPALVERDLQAFGHALFDLQRRAGECFKAAQGGVYADPLLQQIVDHVRERGHVYAAPSLRAAARFEEERVAAAKNTVWATGCRSWYLDDRGIPFLWPFPLSRFTREMESPRYEDFATG